MGNKLTASDWLFRGYALLIYVFLFAPILVVVMTPRHLHVDGVPEPDDVVQPHRARDDSHRFHAGVVFIAAG